VDPDCVEFQKRIWAMIACFGLAAVEDIARRVLVYEQAGQQTEAAAAAVTAGGTDIKRPAVEDPIEIWQHMEDYRFQRCFAHLAEQKLAVQKNELAAWRERAARLLWQLLASCGLGVLPLCAAADAVAKLRVDGRAG
jgi:hypothetical protein